MANPKTTKKTPARSSTKRPNTERKASAVASAERQVRTICKTIGQNFCCLARVEALEKAFTLFKEKCRREGDGERATVARFARLVRQEAPFKERQTKYDIQIATKIDATLRRQLLSIGMGDETRAFIRLSQLSEDEIAKSVSSIVKGVSNGRTIKEMIGEVVPEQKALPSKRAAMEPTAPILGVNEEYTFGSVAVRVVGIHGAQVQLLFTDVMKRKPALQIDAADTKAETTTAPDADSVDVPKENKDTRSADAEEAQPHGSEVNAMEVQPEPTVDTPESLEAVTSLSTQWIASQPQASLSEAERNALVQVGLREPTTARLVGDFDGEPVLRALIAAGDVEELQHHGFKAIPWAKLETAKHQPQRARQNVLVALSTNPDRDAEGREVTRLVMARYNGAGNRLYDRCFVHLNEGRSVFVEVQTPSKNSPYFVSAWLATSASEATDEHED